MLVSIPPLGIGRRDVDPPGRLRLGVVSAGTNPLLGGAEKVGVGAAKLGTVDAGVGLKFCTWPPND